MVRGRQVGLDVAGNTFLSQNKTHMKDFAHLAENTDELAPCKIMEIHPCCYKGLAADGNGFPDSENGKISHTTYTMPKWLYEYTVAALNERRVKNMTQWLRALRITCPEWVRQIKVEKNVPVQNLSGHNANVLIIDEPNISWAESL